MVAVVVVVVDWASWSVAPLLGVWVGMPTGGNRETVPSVRGGALLPAWVVAGVLP